MIERPHLASPVSPAWLTLRRAPRSRRSCWHINSARTPMKADIHAFEVEWDEEGVRADTMNRTKCF